jgi:hypothetical protein
VYKESQFLNRFDDNNHINQSVTGGMITKCTRKLTLA